MWVPLPESWWAALQRLALSKGKVHPQFESERMWNFNALVWQKAIVWVEAHGVHPVLEIANMAQQLTSQLIALAGDD